jgi:hypothetical protein
MAKNGRGSEEDRGEPSAVAPEQNRALGRYIAIWTTNPEEERGDRPDNRRQVEETNVMFGFFHTYVVSSLASFSVPSP